jgi:hypothetical protein
LNIYLNFIWPKKQRKIEDNIITGESQQGREAEATENCFGRSGLREINGREDPEEQSKERRKSLGLHSFIHLGVED